MKIEIKKSWFGKTKAVIGLEELDKVIELSELNSLIDQIFGVKEDKLTFILLKDLPFLKKGTKITYHGDHHGLVTIKPLKLLEERDGHLLDWILKEEVENPGTFKVFLKQI